MSLTAWFVALYLRSPYLIILTLAWNILLMTQWLVLGGCVLTSIETPGEKESAIIQWWAKISQTPIHAVKKAVTLINTTSPMLFQLSRLAGYLEHAALL
jgi:hypothetical protein